MMDNNFLGEEDGVVCLPRLKPISFAMQNMAISLCETCVFHGSKHACLGSVH